LHRRSAGGTSSPARTYDEEFPMRKFLASLALFAAAALLTGGLAAEDKKADPKAGAVKLEGGYTIVSGEKDGKEIPAEHIKGSIVRFAGNKITGTDKDTKEFFASTYTIDTSKKPWAIKMKSSSPKEAEAMGLIKKEGETITIIYALPGGTAPTEFKTTDKQNLFVLKNMNKGDKGDKDK